MQAIRLLSFVSVKDIKTIKNIKTNVLKHSYTHNVMSEYLARRHRRFSLFTFPTSITHPVLNETPFLRSKRKIKKRCGMWVCYLQNGKIKGGRSTSKGYLQRGGRGQGGLIFISAVPP